MKIEQGPCGGYVKTYQSLCNYYNLPVNPDVNWHFQHLPKTFKIFELKRFTKSCSINPLSTLDLGPLFWSLRFNHYFESFVIQGIKL